MRPIVWAMGLAAVALTACSAPRPTVSFEQADSVPAAPYPRSLASADIDADGSVDFAVAIGGIPEVMWARTDSDGHAELAAELHTTDLPYEVATGDFDTDGDPDLLVAIINYNLPELFINSDGEFMDGSVSGDRPVVLESLEAADLNVDGRPDIVGIDGDDDEHFAWQPGHGDGTFGDWQKVPMNAGDQRTTRVGDIDGDGILDVSGSSFWSGKVAVALGAGDGTFGSPVVASLDQMNTSHALLDIDGDGDLELAVGGTRGLDVNSKGARTLIVLDPEDGELRELSRLEMDAWGFASGDLDHDGFDDLLVAGWEGHVYLMQSLGDGTFTPPEKVATASLAADIEIAQLDGQGPLDFAFVDNHAGGLWIYLGEYR